MFDRVYSLGHGSLHFCIALVSWFHSFRAALASHRPSPVENWTPGLSGDSVQRFADLVVQRLYD